MTYTLDTSEIEGDRFVWCGECQKYQKHFKTAEGIRCEECCPRIGLPRLPLVTDDEILGQVRTASPDRRLPAHYVSMPIDSA